MMEHNQDWKVGQIVKLDHWNVWCTVKKILGDRIIISDPRGGEADYPMNPPRFKWLLKCPTCGMDPCACDDDEELYKDQGVEDLTRQMQTPKGCWKHKPLPAGALTSWPSLHDKMAAAKLLNELDKK